ncbi:MAG: hypothetical protein Athens071416_314 [Parcubacteria group bacterium Athens0714_16]|nr:MAG: hypothetical protein Athens071416_314 [Parcubacteria group bacterium Athens0714_16]
MIRFLADIILFLSIFIFPWWVSLLLILFCIFVFNNFYEALFFAFFIDSAYSLSLFSSVNFYFGVSIFVSIVFVFSYYIKEIVKFNFFR